MTTKYTTNEIDHQLAELNQNNDAPWKIKEGKLNKTFVFPDFVEAFGFMTKIAIHAEKANHHPAWFNAYNRVEINLITDDVGGLSIKDFDLARLIDGIGQHPAAPQ